MKIGWGGAEAGNEKRAGDALEPAAQAHWQPGEKDRQACAEEAAHGERQSVGGRVRWKSMGWPHCGQRRWRGADVGRVAGWASSKEAEAVRWLRCCCNEISWLRWVAAKKP